jgi:predicted NAD-dependent protein-ADP-ribosyltransferase YbiA (DUF1768 family)
MRSVLKYKFSQHRDLLEKLKAVEGEIVEHNHWHDTFWGVCEDEGENHLGKLLMQLREEL